MVAAVLAGGCLIRVVGFFVGLIVLVSVIATAVPGLGVLKQNTVLVFDISTPIVERESTLGNDVLSHLSGGSKQMGLDIFRSALRKAASDPCISCLSLEGSTAGASTATLREMRQAIDDFRTHSGKPVFFFATQADQSALYLASVADSLFISPEGQLEMFGVSTQTLYYKDLLDKLGIDVEVVRHGRFKSAVEPYMQDHMSREARQQLQQCVDSIWSTIRSDIAFARSVSPESIDQYIDEMDFVDAASAEIYGLIDAQMYRDQYAAFVAQRIGTDPNRELPTASLTQYAQEIVETPATVADTSRIAVIYASGEIYDGSGNTLADIYADDMVSTLARVRNDKKVKAVVLRVNSPGGSALASDQIWREVNLTAKKMPVVVSMGDYAASGGYYISCAATEIYADPTTLTGSIGVFGVIPCGKDALHSIGVSTDGVSSHAEAEPSLLSQLTDKQRDYYQRSVEKVYQTFVGRVAAGRGMSEAEVDEIAQGRVWTGSDAYELGLVDNLGGIQDAIEEASRLAGLKSFTVEELPAKQSDLERLMTNLNMEARAIVGRWVFGDTYGAIDQVRHSIDKPQIRAEMSIKLRF